MVPRFVAAWALAWLLLAAAAGDARADDLTDDTLLVSRERSIWELDSDGSGEPRELVRVIVDASLVTSIRSAVDGSAALIQIDDASAWVDLTGTGPATPRFLPCSTPAQLSASGDRVACGAVDQRRSVVYQLRPTLEQRFVEVEPHGLRFADDRGNALLSLEPDGIVRTPVWSSGKPELLAPHQPQVGFAVASDGARAVGSFVEDDIETAYTFRLDGHAARRRLMAPAVPLGFSRDGEWLVVQSERRACVVRAVGGQYKCWRGFTAVATSTHGRALLLSRPSDDEGELDYFRARLDGPRSKRPKPVVRGVSGAAAFRAPTQVDRARGAERSSSDGETEPTEDEAAESAPE